MAKFLAYISYDTATFWVFISAAFIVVSIVVVLVMRNYRINKLLSEHVLKIQQNALNSDSQLDEIEQILADTGYAYDLEQKIYYSVKNPWQREVGYCSLYDEWATPLGMVFDSEPVSFIYNGKRWLIEFWKGQYGITSGGEIGIYNTTGPDLDIPDVFKGTFYQSVGDDETITMTFALRRNSKVLFNRADRHWWLTGFALGEYSYPSSLTMDASLTLHDQEMRDIFVEALHKLGYKDDDIKYSDKTVQFTFAKPHSKQPSMRRSPISFLALQWNKSLVIKYKKMTKELSSMYDILMTLKVKSPLLYRLAINAGRQKGLFKTYNKIRRYLN